MSDELHSLPPPLPIRFECALALLCLCHKDVHICGQSMSFSACLFSLSQTLTLSTIGDDDRDNQTVSHILIEDKLREINKEKNSDLPRPLESERSNDLAGVVADVYCCYYCRK